MRAFEVVTGRTRLQGCHLCGEQHRAVLFIAYARNEFGGLMRGRLWRIPAGSHFCKGVNGDSPPDKFTSPQREA